MKKCVDSGAPLLTLVVGDRVRSSVKGVDQRRCLSYMSPQHGGSQDPMQIVHLPGFMNSPVAGSPDPAPHLASVSTACSKDLRSSVCSLFRINGTHSSVLGRVFLSRIQSQPQNHKTKPELFAFTQVPSQCTHCPDLHFQSHHAPDSRLRVVTCTCHTPKCFLVPGSPSLMCPIIISYTSKLSLNVTSYGKSSLNFPLLLRKFELH